MKFVIEACGVVGGIIVSAAMFGNGVAFADDYAGITYKEAASRAAAYNRTPIVSTVLGGRLPLDDCLVTRSQPGKWPNLLFSLSCVALEASATTPGGSAMDPQSREFKKEKEAKDLKWKQSSAGQEWCAATAADHPEWVPIAGCDD